MVLTRDTLSCRDDHFCQIIFKSHHAWWSHGSDTILERKNFKCQLWPSSCLIVCATEFMDNTAETDFVVNSTYVGQTAFHGMVLRLSYLTLMLLSLSTGPFCIQCTLVEITRLGLLFFLCLSFAIKHSQTFSTAYRLRNISFVLLILHKNVLSTAFCCGFHVSVILFF